MYTFRARSAPTDGVSIGRLEHLEVTGQLLDLSHPLLGKKAKDGKPPTSTNHEMC